MIIACGIYIALVLTYYLNRFFLMAELFSYFGSWLLIISSAVQKKIFEILKTEVLSNAIPFIASVETSAIAYQVIDKFRLLRIFSYL